MACTRPLSGYRARVPNPDTGKYSLVWNSKQGDGGPPVAIPCGKCIFCRLEKSRQWAIRCVHEASLHEANCFITLTYSPEHLPASGSIDPDAPVLFMKRLRARFPSIQIRSFGCAEYGELNERPHYHLLIFGFDFPDKYLWRVREEYQYYRSPTLEATWPFGNCEITDLTFETAAYVARYVTKKLDHGGVQCTRVSFRSGKCVPLEHERAVCVSRRPGIGNKWLERWRGDVYADDQVILRGKQMKPPAYYNRIFELNYPEEYEKVRLRRRQRIYKDRDRVWKEDRTTRALVIEKCKEAQFKQLRRGYEDGT